MKRSSRFATAVMAAVGVLCIVIGALLAIENGSGEVIEVDEAVKEVGQIAPDQGFPMRFKFHNRGRRPVRIVGFKDL